MEEKLKQIDHLNPECLKVVLFGPESTGKTSLAKALADHYHTSMVEEYSRSYAATKTQNNEALTKADVLPIAFGQMQLENEGLLNANRVLICDTDLLETLVYSKFYYEGYCPDILKKKAFENHYDLYFLTYIDLPWEADGIRDQPHKRDILFEHFLNALKDANKPYVIIKGTYKERLETCVKHIDNLLKSNS